MSSSNINLSMVVTAVILSMSISSSYALRCYTCNSCEGDDYEAETCAEGQDTCMKVTVDSVTIRACSKEEACAAGKFIQDGIGSAWDSIKGIFNNDIQDTKTGKPMECCTSDYCNNTNTVRNSPVLLMLMMTIIVLHWIKI